MAYNIGASQFTNCGGSEFDRSNVAKRLDARPRTSFSS